MTATHLELEVLSALLDGELDRGRAEEARRHLAECTECAERYAGMQRSVATLRGLAAAAPPPEILHRIRRHAAAIPNNPSLLERLGDWLHPPALRPAFAAAFSLVFAAVLAVYGVNAYYARQAVPTGSASDQPLEAFLRSGVPPGPSGRRPAGSDDAQAKVSEKDKQELRALGYAAPAVQEGVAKKTAAAAAPAREPASAPADRLAQAPGARGDQQAPPPAATDKPALNASRDQAAGRLAADAESVQSSAELGGAAAAPAPQKETKPELEKARAEQTAPEAQPRERAKAAIAPAVPSPSAAAAPQAEEFARQDTSERQIAGRAFTQIDGSWIERGIRPQDARVRIAADSKAGRTLLGRVPGLELLLRDAGVVVLRDGGRVVELRSTKLPPP